MTLLLRTQSHGTVESGFCGPFTNIVRLGDLYFKTEDLCKLIEQTAINPKLRNAQVASYTAEQFYKNLEGTKLGSERNIHVNFAEDKDTISIENYVVSKEHFRDFALYLAKGGHFGWEKDRVPEFAKSVLKAIVTSSNPLYRN